MKTYKFKATSNAKRHRRPLNITVRTKDGSEDAVKRAHSILKDYEVKNYTLEQVAA